MRRKSWGNFPQKEKRTRAADKRDKREEKIEVISRKKECHQKKENRCNFKTERKPTKGGKLEKVLVISNKKEKERNCQ